MIQTGASPAPPPARPGFSGSPSGDSGPGRSRSLASRILLGLALVAVFCTLIGLGTWQVQRRAWKLDLIARVNERVHALPTAPPGPVDWARVSRAADEYRHVRITGVFLNDRETLVRAVTELGEGFWVMTPLRTTRGFTILVNRGFVPPEQADPASRAKGEIAGETIVTGLLRISEPKGAFLRRNDPPANKWYSRDVAAIAAARRVSDAAPYFIDADATPNPGGSPVGGLTVIAFPNSHLVYAITWYTLALMLAGGVVYGVREDKRSRRAAAGL